MKVPLSWLKELIELSLPAKEVADRLTLLGIEVESIHLPSLSFQGVIVGKVVQVTPHPHADRLQIALVTDGAMEYSVVCGASNCRAGLVTAFAPVGASLKGGKIKKSTIRQIISEGMLCSEEELGLSEESLEEILELPVHTPLGIDLATLYTDPIFEISPTPNLGHCLSLLGIARELAASLDIKVKHQKVNRPVDTGSLVHVSVENRDDCPHYTCRAMYDVAITPSPPWLRKKIESCGLKSLNSVIDSAHLVMLERGQPLHIFDLDTLDGDQLTLSSNSSFSALSALDGKEYPIPPHALLLSDRKKPLALAGILGGASSAVSMKTRNLLIESACFSPSSIRKTSRQLNLKTEASYRFSRGTDPEGVLPALEQVTQLIQQLCGGKIGEIIEVKGEPVPPRRITCREKRVNSLLGTSLSLEEIGSILERLEIKIVATYAESLDVIPPSYRLDLVQEVDIIEEIARMWGYQRIERRVPSHVTSLQADTPLYLFEKEVRSLLLREGLQEWVTCNLISPSSARLGLEKGMGVESLISVLHPRSLDQSLLRSSLLPGFLQVVERNLNHRVRDLSVFEIGKIHFREGEKFQEQVCGAVLLMGKTRPYHYNPKPCHIDFFDLKGICENLLSALGIKNPFFEPSHLHSLHPTRQASVRVGESCLGVMGEVHPQLIHTLHLSERLFFAEFNLPDLLAVRERECHLHALSPFPSTERDWTLSIPESVPLSLLCEAIREAASPLLERFFLLDIYRDEKIEPLIKNITFRFIYRDFQQTLSAEGADQLHRQLIENVQRRVTKILTPASID